MLKKIPKISNQAKGLLLFLFVFSIFLYVNTIGHSYAWDDQLVITQNPVTQKGVKGIVEIWTSYKYILARPVYRPVPQTIFALQWQFFPNNPLVGHITNILLYGLVVCSFFVLLRVWFKSFNVYLTTLIVMLFSSLAVHTEVVANIKSMDELLQALFVLWTFILLHQLTPNRIALAGVVFVMALLSKISAITISPILLYILFRKRRSRELVRNFFKKNYLLLIQIALIILFIISLALYLHAMISFTLIMLLVGIALYVEANWKQLIMLLIVGFLLTSIDHPELASMLIVLYLQKNNLVIASKYIPFLTCLAFAPIVFFLYAADYEFLEYIAYVVFILFIVYHRIKEKEITWKHTVILIIFLLVLSLSLDRKFNPLTASMLVLFGVNHHLLRNKGAIQIAVLILTLLALDIEKITLNYQMGTFQSTEILTDVTPPKPTITRTLENNPYHNVLVEASNFKEKSATILRIQLIYLKKLIFPVALVHQHGVKQVSLASWKDWDVYTSFLVHLLILSLAYYFYRKKQYFAMWGILWYIFSISIYTNIIRLMPDTLAERFLFLPSFGFSAALVSGLYFILKKYMKEEKKLVLVSCIILLPLIAYQSYKSIDRAKDWENNFTLAANTIPHAEDNAAVNAQYALELNNLAKYNLIDNKDSVKTLAVKHYKKALNIFPDFYGPNADLASYYILEAQPDSAFSYLQEATRLEPKEWLHHYYLGLIYFERNNYQEALVYFDKIIANPTLQARAGEFPELLEAYEFGARCLHNTGRDQEAYAYLQESIQLFNSKSSYILLGNLYRVTGKTNLAIATFEQLLTLYPEDQEIVNTIDYLKQGLIY